MIHLALRTHLLSFSQISDIVGSRISVGHFHATKTEDFPRISIEEVPVQRDVLLDGTFSSVQFPQFDVVIEAPSFERSLQLCNLVRRAFINLSTGGEITVTLDGATTPVDVEQIDILGEWNEDEEMRTHGLIVKPRILRIRVGWHEDISPLT